MSFKNKISLITGGAGFIGSHLADRLLEQNSEKVIILDNFISGSIRNIKHLQNDKRIEIIRGDVRNFQEVKKCIHAVDYVFHEAASKMVISIDNPREDLETNIIGPFNIIQAALNTNVRIVHASTGSVFGSSNVPMKENHIKNPASPYGISKLAGETYMLYYAKEFGLRSSVIRYFHVFGPRQDYSGEAGVVSIFLARVLQNKAPIIFSGGNQIRCFTFVEDSVDATLLLAKSKNAIGQDYNVASKTRMTVNELAKIIINRYGSGNIKPIYGKYRKGENPKPIPDTSKIEKMGFSAKISFDEGLEITKKWVEKNVKEE